MLCVARAVTRLQCFKDFLTFHSSDFLEIILPCEEASPADQNWQRGDMKVEGRLHFGMMLLQTQGAKLLMEKDQSKMGNIPSSSPSYRFSLRNLWDALIR